MGKTLYRALAVNALIALATFAPSQVHATCPGCVAAINQTTTAVNQVNATLIDIKAVLTTLTNHANQLRLAVGPPATVATAGSFSQGSDFRNFASFRPDYEGMELDKGTTFDFDNLTELKGKMNGLLQIYTDAKDLKDNVDQGRYLETVADIQKISNRRNNFYTSTLGGLLSSSQYSLNQAPAAKSQELTLDINRRGALNLQTKASAAAKTQAELLSRVNHLITLIASQNAMLSAQGLRELPREVRGTETLPPAGNELFGVNQ
jgi:hypothetical protein